MEDQRSEGTKPGENQPLPPRPDHLSPIADGVEFMYRPSDLLLTHESAAQLGPVLRGDYNAHPYEPGVGWRSTHSEHTVNVHRRLDAAGLGLELWHVPTPNRHTLPEIVTRFRTTDDDRAPAISLNHVLVGEPKYQGGPGGEPQAADDPGSPWGARVAGQGLRVDLAVLDTGLPSDLGLLHADLVACAFMDPTDVDECDDDHDGLLDSQAGHGAFICGLVHLVAPGLGIDPGRVLDSTGIGDDLSIALELAETVAPVINLSLGGYTQDDTAPPALSAAIAALGHARAVVAAAGNNGSDRPFWPAALKGVFAVAAYDSTEKAPAVWSNFGPWVDVCAPGVNLRSAFPKGVRVDRFTKVTEHFSGWARWSGTSFAAPLFAAEVARRQSQSTGRTPRQTAFELLSELPESSWPGFGAYYEPPVDPTM